MEWLKAPVLAKPFISSILIIEFANVLIMAIFVIFLFISFSFFFLFLNSFFSFASSLAYLSLAPPLIVNKYDDLYDDNKETMVYRTSNFKT